MLHIYFQSKLIILILLFTSICNVQCAQHPAIHFEIETDQPVKPWTISEHQTVGACNLSAYGHKKNKTK